MVERANEIEELLKNDNISAEIINIRFLKPLDEKTIVHSLKKTKHAITLEDGLLKGGLGSAVIDCVVKNHLTNVKIKNFGYNDMFIPHGKVEEIEKRYGLDAESIHKIVKEL